MNDVLRRYEKSKSEYDAVKITLDKNRQKMKHLQEKVYQMICKAQEILARLNEIALKPNPLTELDYIDLLIESEKQECKPGYRKRLEYLQEARKKAEVIHQAPQWLKNFQNPQFPRVQPTLTHKAHTKGKWWPF